MNENDVKELIDKNIILFDEDHDRFPGVIKSIDLNKGEGDKPHKMIAYIRETQTGKGKVLVEWNFIVSDSDIEKLKAKKEVMLTRRVLVVDMELSFIYHAIIVS